MGETDATAAEAEQQLQRWFGILEGKREEAGTYCIQEKAPTERQGQRRCVLTN
ncbi:MAG: hypothetical protein AAFY20_21670 [Cyanobacteria bacterium J06639_14]